MPTVKIEEEEIYYTHKAAGSERGFVLIHGSGGDHAHWPESLRTFAKANVYGLDLPGHGRSDGVGCTSIDAYADFITAFVQKLNLDKLTLFGHSLGGAIALCLALQQPDWLDSIVLVGTGARLRVAPGILDNLLMDYENTVDLLCQYAFAPHAPQNMVDTVREGFLRTPAEVTHGDLSACNRFDVMEELEKISCSTLVVSGTEDRLTPVKYGQYLKDHIPEAEMAVIPEAGHMMALEKSAEFMQAINTFLKQTPPMP